MSSCERCWNDAHRGDQFSVAEEYSRLIDERRCTPEQQAGPDASYCHVCGRVAIHQYTAECMAGCMASSTGASALAKSEKGHRRGWRK